jgi:tetratricopeptide (TPR) repeat protein
VKRADESFPDWWSVEVMADRLKESDPDQANAIYEKGLTQFPNSAPLMENYAIFLHIIRKEFSRAEEYYRKAVELNPKHANTLGNYAGFLLSRGKIKDGLSYLERVLPSLNDPQTPSGLAAECWFYAFTHRPTEGRGEALRNLKRILQSGDRSPNWNLAPNIDQARKDGHPDVVWLEKLAAVISKEADISILDAWPKWKKA